MALRPKAVLGVGLVVAALFTLLYLRDDACRRQEGLRGGSKGVARPTISASVVPANSVRCNRISLPSQYYNATTAPYNPAAMRHPATGEWFLLHTYDQVSFSLSQFARTGENLGEVLNTHALLMKLGRGEAPSMQRGNYASVAMLEYDDSYLEAALAAGGEWFKAGDWRPFAWKGAIYLAHWIIFAPGEERMAISAIDEAAGVVRLAHVLSPLPAPVAAARRASGAAAEAVAESLSAVPGLNFEREKNWALVEDRGELAVFHSLLPCTVALSFDLGGGNASAPGASARVAARACFGGTAAGILAATGLDILHHPIHGSGNPVPWDVERGADHRELLGVLHVKQGDYAHWAVRIDRDTRRVTHVSAGPVLTTRNYHNDGFLKSAVVVGSFHVVDRMGEDGPERMVRMLYGEGDRFGCWLDVAAEAIVWHAVGEPDSDTVILRPPPLQPAATPHAPAASAGDAAVAGSDGGAGQYAQQLVERGLVGLGFGSGEAAGPPLVDVDRIRPLGGAQGKALRSMHAGLREGLSALGHAAVLHRNMREGVKHGARRAGPAKHV